MSSKRRQEIEEPFGIAPARMFEVLTTPSAIRSWWGVSKAIVDLRKGGTWVTAWGERDEDSDNVTSFKILELDPPYRFVLGSSKYITEGSGTLETDITTEFQIESHPAGCNLRIVQELDPNDPFLDDYFDACLIGWQNCFEGIRNYLHNNPDNGNGSERGLSPAAPAPEPSADAIADSLEKEVDRHLTPEEEFMISRLTAKELTAIDDALLAEASTAARKISRIVGATMTKLKATSIGIPDIFFARRVRKLIGEGKLQVDGNPENLRSAEVRLTKI